MKTKIFLIGVFTIIMCVLLTGCGKQDAKTDTNNKPTETEEIIENNNNETENRNTAELDLVELYSDDSKLVYKSDDSYMVFTYSGDKITGFSTYIEYENAIIAEAALAEYNKDPDPDVAKVYTKGRYLIAEFSDSEYTDFSVSQLKQLFSYLQEVTD